MKILVTGGAGFIGSHVVDAYVAQGHDVVVVDNLFTGRKTNLNPAAAFYQVDIRAPELAEIFAREKPQIVNHHAAQVDVRRSVADPVFDADVNVTGSLHLLECARRHGVEKVIYISTGGAVYGEPEYLPCDEVHPIQPLAPYGASKHAVEHYLFLYRHNHDLPYTILRYPNVYGPRQDPYGEAGVVAIFTKQLLQEEQPTIYGDGFQERDFVYVGDCARANVLALTAGDDGVYNLASGEGTSINELFALLKEITGSQQEVLYGPAKLGETYKIYLDATNAGRELGWRQRVSLPEGLAQTVAHFRRHELEARR
jgi:UDP-glucose 4-epimerase